jgi:multiple sugar transport system ATP-binding protein
MTAPKLELKEISKRFAERDAVRDLSLTLDRGEFLSLLGPSGCGKSTTLGMIAGFIRPDAGGILIDGARVNELSPQRRRIGLVLQDYAVFTRLTVRANLAFGLRVKGLKRSERRSAVDGLAGLFNLVDLLDRRGGSLNMSEMQRVALARTLGTQPELLLLDEPMSNLDAEIRAHLRGELRQLQKSLGQTVLYVTHDQAEALSMSDRIAVMRDGKIVQVASPDDVYHRPVNRFVAEFIGDPPLNLIPCEVRADGPKMAIAVAEKPLFHVAAANVASGRHLLGVRPHDVELVEKATVGALPAPLRFVENFGARHVLHVEYAGELLRIEAEPTVWSIGDILHLRFSARRTLLIDQASERVIPFQQLEAVA